MSEIFTIRIVNNKQIIEKVTFPRFRATIDRSTMEINDLKFIDKCSDPMQASIIKETGELVKKYLKGK